MSTPLHNSLEQAQAELANTMATFQEVRQRLADAGTTVTSKNRAVSVALDAQGNVSEIKFLTSGYRAMAPAELGALLVSTIAEARAVVTSQLAELFEPMMPGGSALDVLSGDFDLEAVMDKAFAETAADQRFFDLAVERDLPDVARAEGRDE